MPKREEPHAQCSPTKNTSHARSVITEFLWCKENLACVRIFYFGSRWKPSDVDVTAIWRERTGNPAWFAGHGSSIRQLNFCWLVPEAAFATRTSPRPGGAGTGLREV